MVPQNGGRADVTWSRAQACLFRTTLSYKQRRASYEQVSVSLPSRTCQPASKKSKAATLARAHMMAKCSGSGAYRAKKRYYKSLDRSPRPKQCFRKVAANTTSNLDLDPQIKRSKQGRYCTKIFSHRQAHHACNTEKHGTQNQAPILSPGPRTTGAENKHQKVSPWAKFRYPISGTKYGSHFRNRDCDFSKAFIRSLLEG